MAHKIHAPILLPVASILQHAPASQVYATERRPAQKVPAVHNLQKALGAQEECFRVVDRMAEEECGAKVQI